MNMFTHGVLLVVLMSLLVYSLKVSKALYVIQYGIQNDWLIVNINM